MMPGIAGAMAGLGASGGGGGGSSGAHRYLKFDFTANNGDTYLAVQEIQAFDKTNGVPCDFSGATITASSSLSTDYLPAKAFDGVINSGGPNDAWAANGNTGSITVDFGAGNAKEISGVTIFSRRNFVSQAPKDFTVQVSDDGVTWATIITVTNSTGWTSGQVYCRTWVSSQNSYSGSPWSNSTTWQIYNLTGYSGFSEIEMRATTGGADQCSGGTASSNNTNNGYVPANAVDNTTATFYVSSGPGEHYWQYLFASGVKVGQVAITARNDAFYADGPTRFMLVIVSPSTGKLFTVGLFTATWTSAGQTQTFTDPNYV